MGFISQFGGMSSRKDAKGAENDFTTETQRHQETDVHRKDAKDAENHFTTETRRHREYDAFAGSGARQRRINFRSGKDP